jgi:hypothetical protein
MKIKIVCADGKKNHIQQEIDELGITTVSTTENTITVETSDAGYEKIMEISGVASVSKDNLFEMWK